MIELSLTLLVNGRFHGKCGRTTFHLSNTLYVYFYARGLQLLKPHGTLAYITSNKFMRAGYGKKLRTFFAKQATLHSVIDFGDLPVFDATAYPTIVIVRHDLPAANSTLDALTVDSLDILQQLPQQIDSLAWEMHQGDLAPTGWALVAPDVLTLLKKLHRIGKPLETIVKRKFFRGIVTGADKIFIIDRRTHDRLIDAYPKNAEIIKPWLRGRDIDKWRIDFNQQYVIFTRRGINIKDYPAIEAYLSTYQNKLEPRPKDWDSEKKWEGRKPGNYEWFEIQDNIAYHDELEKNKIVYQKFQVAPKFALDQSGRYVNSAIWMLVSDNLSLLAVLNSHLGWFLITNHCTQIQNGYQLIWDYFKHIPVAIPNTEQDRAITKLVNYLLNAKGQGEQVAAWERELNALVYELYDLTPAEIALIEANIS